MSRLFALRAALLAAPFMFAACSASDENSSATASEASANTPKGETIVTPGEVTALSEMIMGSDDAPVTVVEYASVTCPHCATFHEQVLPSIKKDYVATGKVRFIFREFPTAPVNHALLGSVVARCAAEKNGSEAYFAVLDALMKTQKVWIFEGDTKTELMKIAAQAGMSADEFDACVERQEILDLIRDNVNEAVEKYEINSTPSFIINGTRRTPRNAEAWITTLDEAVEAAQKTDG